MRGSERRGWVGVGLGVAAVTLAATHCSGGSGPTGWIPRDGTISGVITAPAAALAPLPTAAFTAAVRANTTALPRPPRALPAGRRIASRFPARRSLPALAAATANDLIVTFRHTALGAPPLGSLALARAAATRALGGAMRAHLSGILAPGAEVAGVSPAILTAKIRVADTTARDALAAALRRDPAVAAVTRNHLIRLDPGERAFGAVVHAAATRATPNDPYYPFQSWHYGLIDLPRAWTITTGSAAVLVAVVDDGIRFDHPDIAANLTSDGYAFITKADSLTLCSGGKIPNAGPNNPNGYGPDPTITASYSLDATGTCYVPDALGAHGLHVAGTIGAVGNNAAGVSGVNWTVRIRPVRVLGVGGFGEDYDVAQGVLYAAGLAADNGVGSTVQAPSGAKIINMSLGGPGSDTTLHSAIIAAANAGALIVAAAGNADTSAPSYPAAYPEVVAVAAVGPDGLRAPYSNYGPYVALAAPGGNFALGDATDGVTSTAWNFTGTGSADYAIAEGTSMATPHVSGVAALLLAQNPGLTAAALRSRLTSYAVGPATLGAGVLNAYNSLTQTLGPPTRLYARLYLRSTGAVVATVPVSAGGTYVFTQVADGVYDVFGGGDESGDQQIGVPGRRWGAFGGWTTPGAVTVFGTAPSPAASFPIGFPTVADPDNSLASATPLMVGGYAQGRLLDSTDIDLYRVQVPAAGSYTFETSGWVAACGFGLEEATAIGLFDAAGNFLTQAGYIDYASYNYCSRLTSSLNAGTYYVGVAGLLGRRYRLQARSGG